MARYPLSIESEHQWSFLDSTFVPMPGFNDLLLLHLSSRRAALALVYALQCTVGSLLGCYVLYGLD